MFSSPNLQECLQGVAAVQASVPLDRLETGGVNWWLLMRDEFLRPFTARRSLLYRKHLKSLSHTDPIREAAREVVRPWWRRRPTVRGLQSGAALISWEDAAASKLAGSKPDWVHYGLFRDHNEFRDEALFNRIADSWIESCGLGGRIRKLCPFEPQVQRLRYFQAPVWAVLPAVEEQRSPPSPEEQAFLEAVTEVLRFCRGAGIPLFCDEWSILQRVRRCLALAGHWQAVLEHFGPRFVAMSSFFAGDRLPVLVAAARLGLPVCDIEHGFMGSYSPYAHLSGMPPRAYALFPRLFWCWGEPSAAFLAESLGEAMAAHRLTVRVLGSPWHSLESGGPRAKPVQVSAEARAALEHLQSRARGYQRRLLIVHQPDWLAQARDPQLLPEHLWQVMREAGPDTLWMLRLHPRSRHMAGTFKEAFLREQVGHFEIESPSTVSLADLLPLTDGVLTSFSTIALEFHTAGKPFFVIDDFGVAMLGPYLEEPYSFAGHTRDRLVRALAQAPAARAATFRYFERIADGPATISAMENLLSHAS